MLECFKRQQLFIISMRASVYACARSCVRVFVAGVSSIFYCGCAAETITLLLYSSRARKAYYSYLTPGAVARSVACKLRKQVLRRTMRPAHSFVGSAFRHTLIQEEQVVRYWRKNGHLILVNCLYEASLGTVWLSN